MQQNFEDPVGRRLINEFPNHNWLEKKNENRAVGQHVGLPQFIEDRNPKRIVNQPDVYIMNRDGTRTKTNKAQKGKAPKINKLNITTNMPYNKPMNNKLKTNKNIASNVYLNASKMKSKAKELPNNLQRSGVEVATPEFNQNLPEESRTNFKEFNALFSQNVDQSNMENKYRELLKILQYNKMSVSDLVKIREREELEREVKESLLINKYNNDQLTFMNIHRVITEVTEPWWDRKSQEFSTTIINRHNNKVENDIKDTTNSLELHIKNQHIFQGFVSEKTRQRKDLILFSNEKLLESRAQRQAVEQSKLLSRNTHPPSNNYDMGSIRINEEEASHMHNHAVIMNNIRYPPPPQSTMTAVPGTNRMSAPLITAAGQPRQTFIHRSTAPGATRYAPPDTQNYAYQPKPTISNREGFQYPFNYFNSASQ